MTDPTPQDIAVEVAAMTKLSAVLAPLTPEQRRRVLDWARVRFDIAPVTRNLRGQGASPP